MKDELDYRITGFPSPAAEYAEDRLCLNSKFMINPPATFFVRASTNSKIYPILKGDILLINKALNPKHGDLVIAVILNEFVLAKFMIVEGQQTLYPFNKIAGDDEEGEDFVWGVVASIHRALRV